MIFIMLFMIILFLIFILVLSVMPTINIHKKTDREKSSPFECGFDPFSKPRTSFSIHFFSISMMFLIFDIEITLLLPTPITLNKINMTHWILSSSSLFLILILGLVMEWKEGSMNWT